MTMMMGGKWLDDVWHYWAPLEWDEKYVMNANN